jgi:uncharacterized protein with PIN domain
MGQHKRKKTEDVVGRGFIILKKGKSEFWVGQKHFTRIRKMMREAEKKGKSRRDYIELPL